MRLTNERPDAVLGLDIGTQSVKCVALNVHGRQIGAGQIGYPIHTPRPHWAEQNPRDWWEATITATRQALRAADLRPGHVRGLGVTGQMHGLVLLDRRLQVLRPAIIWLDRRSANLCAVISARVPAETVHQVAANRLSPGFAGASLAWLREADPQTLAEAHIALSPKDYVVLRLTGVLSSEPSDASATWLFDVPRRAWSAELASACSVARELLPPLHESAETVGTLSPDAAYALGLKEDTPVVAGAGDQAALLMGMGVVESGRGAITLGTGGQMAVVSDRPRIDPQLRLNTFCHAVPQRWYTMGAILNAGLALRWWRDVLGQDDPSAYARLLNAARDVPTGAEGLIFLPYLSGERTPHMDAEARGAFVGLTTRHTQAHITRAVLEGVAFAFRDCLLTLREAGPVPDHFLVGGGGARGALWRQILADVLGVSLQRVSGQEHTALGAAMLAGLGTGLFYDLAQAVALAVRYEERNTPAPTAQGVYAEVFARYQVLYPALRALR